MFLFLLKASRNVEKHRKILFLLFSVKKKKSFLLNYVLLKKVWEDHDQIINTSGEVYIQDIDSAVSPQSTDSLASLRHPFSTLLVLTTYIRGSTLGLGQSPSSEPSPRTARHIHIKLYPL